jgi:hypothetical protein
MILTAIFLYLKKEKSKKTAYRILLNTFSRLLSPRCLNVYDVGIPRLSHPIDL